jgi:hypothetical protein
VGPACSFRCPEVPTCGKFLVLLKTLQGQHDCAWHNIVTLDESWFYYAITHEWTWPPTDEKVPERQRQAVQSKKLSFTIVWNPNGFDLIDFLPNGSKFNASYYVNNVLGRVSQWR